MEAVDSLLYHLQERDAYSARAQLSVVVALVKDLQDEWEWEDSDN